MAGRRMVYAKMCESNKFGKVSAEAERLWVRVLTRTDDNGNFHADPKLVRGFCLPQFDYTLAQVKGWIDELAAVDLIAFYGSKSDSYIHVTGFTKYQKLRRDRTPFIEFPAHPESLNDGQALEQRAEDTVDDDPEEDKPVKSRETAGGAFIAAGLPVVNHPHTNGNQQAPISRSRRLREGEIEEKVKTAAKPPSSEERKQFRISYRRLVGKSISGGKFFDSDFDVACRKYGFDIVLECMAEWVEQRGKDSKTFTYANPLQWFFKTDLADLAADKMVIQTEDQVQKEVDRIAAEKNEAYIQEQKDKDVAFMARAPEQNGCSLDEFLSINPAAELQAAADNKGEK